MLTDNYVRKEMSSDKRRKIKETLYYLEHHFGNLDNMVLEVNKHAANDIEFYLDHKNEIRFHINHDNSLCGSFKLGWFWYYTTKMDEAIHVKDFPNLKKAWDKHGVLKDDHDFI